MKIQSICRGDSYLKEIIIRSINYSSKSTWDIIYHPKYAEITNYCKLNEQNQVTDQNCLKNLFPVEEVIPHPGKNS